MERPMRYDSARMVSGCIATAPADTSGPPANCLAKSLETTSVNLTRANEIVETIISRIEGSGSCGKDVAKEGSSCLMNCAIDCSCSASHLTERLDYLARII